MKLLSIIVPTYNMEALLEKDLNSLVLETEEQRAKLDVIVVNDGSKDRSSEIAHQFADRYPEEFRVLDKANGHYGSCINAALPLIQGKYVRIMDADDSYYTENLPAYLDVLEKQDAELVLSPFDRIDEDDQVTKHEVLPVVGGGGKNPFNYVQGRSTYLMHHVAYLSAIFKRIDYHQTEGILYTDAEWIFHPMSEVRSAYFFDRPIYRYLEGRAGQSFDLRALYTHLDHEVMVIMRLLTVLKGIPASNPAYDYLNRFVDSYVQFIYGTGLAKGATLDLNAFDKTLQDDYPEVYRRADRFVLDVGLLGLKFHFIRAWRKVRDRRKMKFFPLYALFCLLSRYKK